MEPQYSQMQILNMIKNKQRTLISFCVLCMLLLLFFMFLFVLNCKTIYYILVKYYTIANKELKFPSLSGMNIRWKQKNLENDNESYNTQNDEIVYDESEYDQFTESMEQMKQKYKDYNKTISEIAKKRSYDSKLFVMDEKLFDKDYDNY